ncbi:TPA: peptidase M14 [Vibrio fluvialis]|nr:peptidase M14 [Vibrio fluvialis]
MTTLLSQVIHSSLSEWVAELSQSDYRGHQVELWTFNDQASRAEAQRALRELGIEAFIYSAYKPLVHFCLESTAISESVPEQIEVRYPLNPHASEKRFLLEAYPLGALLQDKNVRFVADSNLTDRYQLNVTSKAGQTQSLFVLAPNLVRPDATGAEQLSPTAWLRITNPEGKVIKDEALSSDYEQAYRAVMQVIAQHDWPNHAPYFQRLEINIQLPTEDDALGYDHEVISLREALHEDLYFSIQEWFKTREGKNATARDCQPGQIVPNITRCAGSQVHIDVALTAYQHTHSTHTAEVLASAGHPLSEQQVMFELETLGGEPFAAHTVSGKRVNATYIAGSDKAVVVSGGQHANETTGVVGVLRAARLLSQQANAHLVISPLENPDGYALHQELIQSNPHHMHHAARYTALGDDLEYRTAEPLYEKAIRRQAQALSQAQLHVNLHGYPSHEWTRPFSGYVPQGFEMWTIPKGFFLVVRHLDTPQWQEYAERFVDALTLELQHCSEVIAMNRKQIALYEQHAGETGFRMINGYPCFVSSVEQAYFPLQLITEYPDESIYGDDFIAGHTVQMETVLAAYRVHQSLS